MLSASAAKSFALPSEGSARSDVTLSPGSEAASGTAEAAWALQMSPFSPVGEMNMDAPTLRALLAARRAAPADTLATLYVEAESGRPEALVAVYETAALPLFEAAVSGKRIRLNNVVPAQRQRRLAYAREAARPFFNLNSPGDLRLALDLTGASR